MRLRTILLLTLLAGAAVPTALSTVVVANESQSQPPKDFVPVTDASQQEQIPALPLIAAAYGFIWVGVLAYVWSLARRMQHVETELAALETKRR